MVHVICSPAGSHLLQGNLVNKKHLVDLTEEECNALKRLVDSGRHGARRIRWAHALLKADANWSDEKIAEAFDISIPTVQRLRQRFVEEGLDVALGARSRKPRPYSRKLDGEQEARLIALTGSHAPEGHTRWTLRMLADKMVELSYVGSVSHETVRRVLKKTT
jgi:transposase